MALSKEQEEEILAKARKEFAAAQEFWSVQRDLQRDDIRFAAASPDNKAQWDPRHLQKRESDPDGPRPCLTINRVPQHVNQVVNDHRMNRPRIKVRPEDSKADPEVADIYDGIIRNIEKVSKAHISYTLACHSQVVGGAGYWMVKSRYVDDGSFKQELVVEPIMDPLRVLVDPEAQMPDASDAKFIFLLTEMDQEDYQKEYKEDPSDWDSEDLHLWHDTGKQTVIVADYFTFKTVKKKIYQLTDGRVVAEEMLREAGGQIANERTVEVKRLCWYKMSGTKVLDYRETSGKYHLIVRALGNRFIVDNEIHVSGLVRNFKDPARTYNYLVSTVVERLALQSRAPVVGYEGQFEGHEDDWATSNWRNVPYLEIKPVTDNTGSTLPMPQRMAAPPDLSMLVQAMSIASEDMKNVTGQYNASLGQQSNETSGKAIMARQREGDVGSFHFVDNMNDAILQTGRILVDSIPYYYDTAQVLTIIGEDNKPGRAAIDPAQADPVRVVRTPEGDVVGKIYNLKIGRYDVDIQLGAGFETRRQEMVTAMSEVIKGNPALWQVVGDQLVRAMDWPDANKMAERLKYTLLPEIRQAEAEDNPLPPEIASQIAQAQQQIQQQQQMMAEQGQAMAQAQEQAVGDLHKAQMAKKDLEIMAARIEAEQQQLQLMRQLLDARTNEQKMKLEVERNEVVNEIEDLLNAKDSEDKQAVEAFEEKAEQGSEQITQGLQQQVDAQTQLIADLQAQFEAMQNRSKRITLQAPGGGVYVGESLPNGDGTSLVRVTTPSGEVYRGINQQEQVDGNSN